MRQEKVKALILISLLLVGCQTGKDIPKRDFSPLNIRPHPKKSTPNISPAPEVEIEVNEPVRWFIVVIGSMLFIVYGTAWYMKNKHGT